MQKPSYQVAKNIVTFSLLFSWATIAALLIRGDAANSLHQSALSWSYTTALAVIGAYCFDVYFGKFKKNEDSDISEPKA